MSHNIFDIAQYESVTAVKTLQEVTVRVEHVKVGDTYLGTPVTEVKVGRKWVYLTAQGATRVWKSEIEIGTTVLVERQTETEESAQARHRAWASYEVCDGIAKAQGNVDSALATLNDRVATYGAADDRAFAGLMQAQATNKIVREFVQFATHESNAHLEDAAAARDAFIAEVLVPRLSRSNFRALSRSTSVLDNLLEDVDREAVQRFIDTVRWGF